MAFEESNGMVMPVAPANSYGNGGFMGGDWGWIVLLLLLAGNGGAWEDSAAVARLA